MITGKQIAQAKELSKEINSTTAEALNIIVQNDRNYILKQAFVITDSDKSPTALEAIAIALGYNERI